MQVARVSKFYFAECFDLPLVTQGETLDELVKNVKEAVATQLEGENPADFGLAPDACILVTFEIESGPCLSPGFVTE